MKRNFLKTTAILLVVIGCVSFVNKTNETEPQKGKWVKLFDGKSLKGWHGFNKTGTVKNWEIEDGALVCLGAAKDAHGGDIVTNTAYDNFELKWEWKIDRQGNSGVMYHVVEGKKYKSPYETGPEYQMIDDNDFPEKLEDWQKTGADYAMNIANDKKKVNPVGEWNTSKIIFNKGHVEHWLNGEKIVSFQAWDAKWLKEKQEGKWKDYPDYGLAKKGLIALQDHGHKAYYKNIMIKAL
ncbi:MAG: DUF1080 domain-containing protein [Methylotenera sp.]|nr:DUF1080 domain-containing protein [Flavobacterium sp.]